jgi:tRNA(Arg) A34 adenosine deaminase TadA
MSPDPFDLAMMQRALRLAQQAADLGEVPVAAVVYHARTGDVLAEATNRRERDRDPAGHAEFEAVRRACRALGDWRLNDYSLAVTLEPCCMCAGLLVNARVGRVVFGALDPKAGAVRSLHQLLDDPRLNHRANIVAGVLADECSELLRRFFRSLRTDAPR